MYRAVHADGQISCDTFDRTEYGVELYNENGEMIAFIPYQGLHVVINEDVDHGDDEFSSMM